MCPLLQKKVNYYMNQFNGIKCFDSIHQVVENCSTYFSSSRNLYKDDTCIEIDWTALSNAYGIYMFIDSSGCQILYIGEAHNQKLKERICQHFADNDTGGLKYKFGHSSNMSNHTLYERLENSALYVIKANANTSSKEILYFESFLIGALQPPINFCNKV